MSNMNHTENLLTPFVNAAIELANETIGDEFEDFREWYEGDHDVEVKDLEHAIELSRKVPRESHLFANAVFLLDYHQVVLSRADRINVWSHVGVNLDGRLDAGGAVAVDRGVVASGGKDTHWVSFREGLNKEKRTSRGVTLSLDTKDESDYLNDKEGLILEVARLLGFDTDMGG